MDLSNCIKASASILNQLPGSISIMTLDHKFAWTNTKAINSFGFKSLHDIRGKSYFDMKCKASENAEIFEAQENLTFSKRISLAFISYQQYSDGWKLTLWEKAPLINDFGELIGLIAYWIDITNYGLADMSRYIFNAIKMNGLTSGQFAYRLEDESSNCYDLSQRQLECLFFLLRSKTDKEIAKILQLSPRTVESYIFEIKFKMHCSTRAQVIEKAIEEGMLNTLPKSFFQKNILSICR